MNPPTTQKALQRPRKRLPEGFSSVYSQIVFPTRFSRLGKLSHYAHIVPVPKPENPGPFVPVSAAGHCLSRGPESPATHSAKSPFATS